MIVSAVEKSTGKEHKITIKNDKGRLSKSEVEKMVADAEKFKEEDEKNAARIEAKSKLENYCYSIKQTLNDEKLQDKISEEDKTTVTENIEETLKWLSDHQDEEKEIYTEKYTEFEQLVTPIMTKIYQQSTPEGGMPAGMPWWNAPRNGRGNGWWNALVECPREWQRQWRVVCLHNRKKIILRLRK